MKKSLSRIVLAVLLAALFSNRAAAWGPVGHETIAYIAEDNLTPKAKEAVQALLEPSDDIASVSNWADKIRLVSKGTAPWHFIDLPIRENVTVETVKEFATENECVISALEKQTAILRDTNQPKSKRQDALKFVIHFVGDLHQPLHCSDDSDRGGNDKIVRYKTPGRRGRGTKLKLHGLWDGLIEIHNTEDPRELADSLESKITEEKKQFWDTGNLDDWALEGYLIAKNKIYPGMEPGPQDYSANPLPKDYFYRMRPLVDQQLEKAGIRLASLLNGIFQ